jgi:hypothetical protein
MQTQLTQLEYKFGFDFGRKNFPNCLAKAPYDDDHYLVIDYYKPRGKEQGWYVALRKYGGKRPVAYLDFIHNNAAAGVTYADAKSVLIAELYPNAI